MFEQAFKNIAYGLRGILDHIDELRFRSRTEKHELSHLYEARIKNMGPARRNGGEYCGPLPNATRFNNKVAGTLPVPSANSRVFKGYGTWKVPATF